MRLLWTVVLLLFPLVAELATAQRCRGTPDDLEHGNIRCFKKRGTCRVTCDEGYIFAQKNSRTAMYGCVGGTEWIMRDGEDTCSPQCDPPCENGECVEPNVCKCNDGFIGNYCEEEEYEYEAAQCDPPCENGECVEPNVCECNDGFIGNYCEEEEYEYEAAICDPPCQNGECVEPNVCKCDDGFIGNYCEEEDYDYDAVYEGSPIPDDGDNEEEEEEEEEVESSEEDGDGEEDVESSYVAVTYQDPRTTGAVRKVGMTGPIIGGAIFISLFVAGAHHFYTKRN